MRHVISVSRETRIYDRLLRARAFDVEPGPWKPDRGLPLPTPARASTCKIVVWWISNIGYFAEMRRILLSIGIVLSIGRASADAQLRTQTVVSGLSSLVAAVPDPTQPGVIYAESIC